MSPQQGVGRVVVTIDGIEHRAVPGAPLLVGPQADARVPPHVFLHEAGHAVVAHSFGWSVVSIEATEMGYSTGCEGPRDPTKEEHLSLAIISLGGPAAQERAGVGRDDGCEMDLDQAVGSVLAYLGEDPAVWVGSPTLPSEVEPVMLRAGRSALEIVTARWAVVVRIAEALEREVELDRDQLARLLGEAHAR